MDTLSRIPLASLLVVVVVLVASALVLLDSITFGEFQDFLIGIGILAGGAGVLGEARNRAGHGVS